MSRWSRYSLVGCSLLGVDVDDGALGEAVNVLRVGSPACRGGGERAEWSCCHAVFFLSCLSAVPLVRASVSRLRYHV